MLKIRHIVYATLLLSLLGCGKKFLEQTPQAAIVIDTFYKTEADIIAAVNAAYNPLTWESDRKGQIYAMPFFFGDICSDDAIKGGGSLGDIPNFNSLETFTGNASYPELILPWQRSYIGIYRANLVIENAPNSIASKDIVNRVIAEAKFLRAYYHFELVKYYGDVPLVTTVLGANEKSLTRTPKDAVYAQIEADLQEAANTLPDKAKMDVGRANKGAALALLARVQLFQTSWNTAKWNDVLQNCTAIINSKVYDLEPNYADIHTVAHENGIESIFEIQALVNSPTSAGDNGSSWGNGNLGSFINVFIGSRNPDIGGYGFNCPSKSLLDEFRQEKSSAGGDDLRLKATIALSGDTIFGKVYEIDATSYPNTGTLCRKYVEPSVTNLNASDGPSNYRIIRYADILLMAAEAANELSDEVTARKYLNLVRARAKMPDVTTTGQENLRNAIYHERRVELAMEGLRFFDLVRQGRAATVMQSSPEGFRFRAGVNEVFPIPQTEVDLSNGKVTQNPGY